MGIQLLNSSIVDGAIYCKVRRDVVTNVNGQTFDLINDQYNLLIAAGSSVTGNQSLLFISHPKNLYFLYFTTQKSLFLHAKIKIF